MGNQKQTQPKTSPRRTQAEINLEKYKEEIKSTVPTVASSTEVKPIYELITNKATKIELISRFGSMTVQKIAHEQFPSIGQLQREHGEEKTVEAIATILNDMNKAFGDELDKEDLLEVITQLVNGMMRNITLEGLYLTCQEIKMSNSYGKLTINKVLTLFKKHLNEQINARHMLNYNNHLAQKFSGNRKQENPFDDADYKRFKNEMKTMTKKGKL